MREESFEIMRPHQSQRLKLKAIPGVDWIVAATTIARFCDFGRFANANKAASYGELIPSSIPLVQIRFAVTRA